MTALSVILAFVLLGFQQGGVTSSNQTSAEQRAILERERHRQAAIEINDLPGRIHSEADALAFVDKLADFFTDILPPAWVTRGIRQRIARAEYEAVSDPSRLVPEQRIADVWNKYVREIGASEEALVTVAEIHNLRDADLSISQLWWSRMSNQIIWTMPNVYAVGPDGKVADGCRAVETLRVLYDLDMLFDNLRGARDRVRKGTLASDELKKRQDNPPPKQKATYRLEAQVDTNPIRRAEYRYLQEHGPYILTGVMEKLFDELFPATD
jgi:hypothetical protein